MKYYTKFDWIEGKDKFAAVFEKEKIDCAACEYHDLPEFNFLLALW